MLASCKLKPCVRHGMSTRLLARQVLQITTCAYSKCEYTSHSVKISRTRPRCCSCTHFSCLLSMITTQAYIAASSQAASHVVARVTRPRSAPVRTARHHIVLPMGVESSRSPSSTSRWRTIKTFVRGPSSYSSSSTSTFAWQQQWDPSTFLLPNHTST